MARIFAALRMVDWVLFSLVGLLVLFGLVVLYSLTLNVDTPDLVAFHDQLIFAAIGLVVFLAASLFDYHYINTYGWALYLFGAIILIAVALFGREIRGARSWFVVGPISIQPVELAKVSLVVFFAKYFSRYREHLYSFRHILVSGAGAGVYLMLIMLQPDLGSAMILIGAFLCFAVLVNVHRSHLVILSILVVTIGLFSWFFLLRGYQKDRIRNVFNPNSNVKIGYNVRQSMVAVGSGKFFGRGLGLGTQSQLKFLPEQKTDFIFAVIAEELGFVGAAVLISIFVLLLIRLYRIARNTRDDFAVYFIFGIFIVLFIQMVMNIGMNIGIMPVAGVPLPFVSAGGSSLISLMLAMGIIESIAIRNQRLASSR